MVTAKMTVTRCDPQGDAESPWAWELLLTPNYSNGANAEWAAATPSASFRMTVKNEHAVTKLPVGTNVTVQIVPE